MKPVKNIAASVHDRLLQKAKQSHRPFNEVVQYYALERWLYRLAQSEYRRQFVLKGALMLLVWKTPVTRPTRDMDFLGRISNNLDSIREVIIKIGQMPVEEDGLIFDAQSLATERITEESEYSGVRAKFLGTLGNTTLPMQIDIGFNDVITPESVEITYPTLLDHSAPQIQAYNRETAIAEKFETMVKRGELNSRMKDFFDIWMLSQATDFHGQHLSLAIEKTFQLRGTVLEIDPICFSSGFAHHPDKAKQWRAFIRRGLLVDVPEDFSVVVEMVRVFLLPIATALAARREFLLEWRAGGPWYNNNP